ncbi:FAD-binding oxidoreductase, partial [Burkholderia mallei]|uniref:FAD-binding oxidoreductase n=1 Tax=Burkholderia mallei TaxID=13373 RepID=UPI001177F90D
GQLNAPKGGLCIDMSQMNAVVAVNEEDLTATVQAGVTREQLNQYLRSTGLFFPLDPGANATIGGMVSTRA